KLRLGKAIYDTSQRCKKVQIIHAYGTSLLAGILTSIPTVACASFVLKRIMEVIME
ncbi:hypothetical protein L9F63_007286, partial [Diploptera punctata]